MADDDLTEALIARDDPGVEANLARALLAYDELAVSTFHAYAQRTLTSLGSREKVDPDAGILTDQRELLAEVSADVLAVAAQQAQAKLGDEWRSGLQVLPTLSTLVEIAGQRTDLPDLLLDPAHDTPELCAGSSGAMLAHLAEEATAAAAAGAARQASATTPRSSPNCATSSSAPTATSSPSRCGVVCAWP